MKYLGFILASVLPMALAYEYRVGVGKDETTGYVNMRAIQPRRALSYGLDAREWASTLRSSTPKPETPLSSNSEAVLIVLSVSGTCLSIGPYFEMLTWVGTLNRVLIR